MQQYVEHVVLHIPNDNMCVTYLLYGIQYNDSPLQADMALVRNVTMTIRNTNEFEVTALYLLQHDPVSNNRATGNKISVSEISDTYGAKASVASSSNPATSMTGV